MSGNNEQSSKRGVPPLDDRPVVVIGAGPVGLMTALGLRHYGVPVIVLEEDAQLSIDTKAGTVLTRTLEIISRYGALAPVLRDALRIDEIGEIDRSTGRAGMSVKTGALVEDTRLPFVINIPQDAFEASLGEALGEAGPEILRLSHKVVGFEQDSAGVSLQVQSPEGLHTLDAAYVLACDGGRSSVRAALGIEVEGMTLEERYMLVDLKVDLDVENPRDYPYLAYFSDPDEWMILVRQPHCWRFLFPLKPGLEQPGAEELRDKALHFIGEVDNVEVIGSNIYTVHQRVAHRWRDGRVFLMGDAAHLITPMWALGLNTGALDASNLPWRMAWVHRGWASPALLDGYELEQSTLASRGSGQMAESAREAMHSADGARRRDGQATWGLAMTRTLLGISLDVEGSGEWSIVRDGDGPAALQPGDRAPDLPLFGPQGERTSLHELVADSFVALHFRDARRSPELPPDATPGLVHRLVSRWDAPHDSGLRARAYFDPGDRVRMRLGVDADVVVLIRPDAHVAGLSSPEDGPEAIEEIYRRIVDPAEERQGGVQP